MNTFTIRNINFESKEESGKRYLTGMIPFNSRSADLGGFTEVIKPTAFNKTLADKKNVRALLNHEKDKLLGDINSGTLSLETLPEGLRCTVEVPDTSYARDAFSLISRGIGNSMSFGFWPVKQIEEPETRTRYLTEVKLGEVSFLTYEEPAYPASSAKVLVRSIENDLTDLEGQEIDLDLLISIRDKIDNMIPKKEVVTEVPEIKPDLVPEVEDTSKILLEIEIENLLN